MTIPTRAAVEQGWYSFDNLLIDEDYNGDGNGLEPSYSISIDSAQPELDGLTETTVDAASATDDKNDSDAHSGTSAQPVQGLTDTDQQADPTDEQAIAGYDFGYNEPPLLGAIGNYVWVDENADGQQDEGERGIPNVIVNLTDSNGNVFTTTTDTDGGYLFPDLPAGTYTVTISPDNFLPGGALEGMEQTPLTGDNGDFGNKDDAGYPIDLAPGEENLTADFGYNPNDPDDVNNNENNAALGDYVWIDSDGDGAQDPGEIPVAGVVLVLYTDPDGDGVYDTPIMTDTTDANGYYLFDNLPAGSYVVKVVDSSGASHDVLGSDYTQTGDPDHFGTTGTNNDNMSDPVVLAPGDVFLNVDFGYQPEDTTPLNTIGDTVWLDIDADGVEDPDENGIPGVTVALIEDTNGNGVWDPGEPIIAVDTTDENGMYLFEDLPDGDYLVWVNDTDNVLDDLDQTYDNDGTNTPNISAVSVSGGETNLDQDFGYTPEGQDPNEGAIGDTIWLNTDGDNEQDPDEPGIEGVVVQLELPNGSVITTTTDENGNYYFGGLDPDGTYIVTIPPENFDPGGPLEGLEETFDPDGGTPMQSVVTLTPSDPIDLDQDFGYTPPTNANGSIGNRVWLDQNADGVWDDENGPDGIASTDDDEPGIAGVTIDLYRDLNGNGIVDAGEPRLATTKTITDGTYLFDNLPLGDYVVDVTDEDGVLAGYWHSLGDQDVYAGDPTADEQDQSKADPVAVSIGGANPNDNLNVDFGYYVEPAAVGNYTWIDANNNGIQDSGEEAIDGVTVTLQISYPDGTVVVLTTVSGDDPSTAAVEQGWYSFGNLLLDEDFNMGSGAANAASGLPGFEISAETPDGYTEAKINVAAATDDKNDSDDHDGTAAKPVQGLTDVTQQADPTTEQTVASYDFGYVKAVKIGNYIWIEEDGDGEVGVGEVVTPVVGLIVTATGPDGSVYTGTTDANGLYTITVPANQTYTLTVTAPPGTNPSTVPSNPGDDQNHGTEFTVAVGEDDDLTLDIAFTAEELYAIGNFVWLDEGSADGVYDSGTESGIGGVRVELYRNGQFITFTTTTNDGGYLFDNLIGGEYEVVITTTNFISGNALYDQSASTPLMESPVYTGTTPTDDVMVGVGSALQGVRATVTVGDAAEPTAEDKHGMTPSVDDDKADETVDFGFFLPDQTAVGLSDTGTSNAVGLYLVVFVAIATAWLTIRLYWKRF